NRSFLSTPGRTLRLPSTRPNDPGKLKRLGVARARQTGQVSPWFELKFLKEKSGGMYKSKKMRSAGAASLFFMTLLFAMPQAAWSQANCRNTGSFEAWLANFKKEAAAKGISPGAIAAASPYLVLDQRIINIDRGQRFFAQNFLEISDKMLAGGRLPQGAAQMKKHQAVFAPEDKDFVVPASLITAFWGLESDFGAGQGKDHAIKSLATLAYDCRRSDMFRGHLLDALRLIDRGDLHAEEMIGSWAGELGQTQMMPSEYMAHAIDYD